MEGQGLTKAFLANVVLCKGTSHGLRRRSTRNQRVVSWSSERVIRQSDQEGRIIYVNHEAGTHIPIEIIYEESTVGDSNSMGGVKRANQTIQELIRVIASFTERQIGALDSSPLEWLVRHAAWKRRPWRRWNDSAPAHKRQLVQTAKTPRSVSRSSVNHTKTSGPQQKLDLEWSDGCWLGFNTRAGEHIVRD